MEHTQTQRYEDRWIYLKCFDRDKISTELLKKRTFVKTLSKSLNLSHLLIYTSICT